ncbi:MAG: cation:proton antiporter [Anaerolineae bacterium]|nr:cation:proton antiporter [Anaerolineae bacterium]
MTTLFLALSILIVVAQVSGLISRRLGQTSMVGALIAGALLGAGGVNLSARFPPETDTAIRAFAEIGFLLLVFSAGLEIDPAQLREYGRPIILSGWLGVILSMVLVTPIMLLAGFDFPVSLFVAIALAGTGNGVATQMAFEMNLIRTKEGVVLLGAAMIDDVLVLLALAFLISFGQSPDLAGILLRFAVYLTASGLIGWLVLPRLLNFLENFNIPGVTLGFGLSVMFLYAWAADAVGGMTPILGAFIAGIALGRASCRPTLQTGIRAVAEGVFIPVFLINIGLRTDIRAFDAGTLPLAVALLVAAVLGKIVGCGGGARLGGFTVREGLHVGISMIPRGAVGLALTTLGLETGLLPADLFPEIVLVILITTVIAPILLRWYVARTPVLAASAPWVSMEERA